MASGTDSRVATISSDSPSEPQAEGAVPARRGTVENTVRVLLPLPLGDAYDYRVPEGIFVAPGQFVVVPLGKRVLAGVAVEPEAARRDAAGRFDAFWEFGLSEWDMAAGALLIQEAGGLVSDFTGGHEFLEKGQIVAGNTKCFKAVLTAIQPHLAPSMKR